MSSLLLFALIMIGVLYSIYTKQRIQTQRLKSVQKRYEIQNPVVDYNYNRLNTKKERSATLNISEEQFYALLDIQNIRIAKGMLISKISSEYDNVAIQFDLIVKPFEKDLFEVEGYRNFTQQGIMIFWSYGDHTKFPLESIEELNFLEDIIPRKPKGFYLKLSDLTVDGASNTINLIGTFEDGQDFMVTINHQSYLLELKAPMESVQNFSNFRDYEGLVKDHLED